MSSTALNSALEPSGEQESLEVAEGSDNSILYLEDQMDSENLYADAIKEEVESTGASPVFYMSPGAIAITLEDKMGQYQTELFDMPEEKRVEEQELPEFAEKGLEEAARVLDSINAEEGRIDIETYEREGSPQYLDRHQGLVSEQVAEQLISNLDNYDAVRFDQGYVLQL